jgi:CDP-diacylglycerol--glycerol-3-phosphate 3-phosphatidyltransferase
VEEAKPKEQEFLKALHETANHWRLHNSRQQHQEPNSTSSPAKIKILMDASRARRKVIIHSQHKTHTCSADTVFNCIYNRHLSTQSDQEQQPNYGVYLFHVHPFTQYLLPSPVNEAVGVFHMKAYVIDDTLILSGANLSEEYFVNRHDRYLVFTHGANGLVDFYADLIELLCNYSERYHKEDSNVQLSTQFFSTAGGGKNTSLQKKYNFTKARQRELFHQLVSLFQPNSSHDEDNRKNDNAIAYAVPTIHFPISFIKELNFASDVPIIQNLIHCAKHRQRHAHFSTEANGTLSNTTSTESGSRPLQLSVRLASAYLNPTSTFMNTLMMIHNSNENKNYFTASSLASLLKKASEFFHVGTNGSNSNNQHPTNPTTFMLTAGKNSHGFAPKKTQCSTRTKNTSWVPEAYQHIYSQLYTQYNQNGSLLLLLFNRENWTFHSKGLWLSAGYETQIQPTDVKVDIVQSRLQQKLDQSHIWYPHNLRVVVVGSGEHYIE